MCFSQHTSAHDLNVTNCDDLFMQLPFIALHEFLEAEMETPNDVYCLLFAVNVNIVYFSFILLIYHSVHLSLQEESFNVKYKHMHRNTFSVGNTFDCSNIRLL